MICSWGRQRAEDERKNKEEEAKKEKKREEEAKKVGKSWGKAGEIHGGLEVVKLKP